jgi:hypothetical protein
VAKKKKHPSPKEYRLIYKINNCETESVQYYNIFHSSEALDSLIHTFKKGHIHGRSLRILCIEEFNHHTNSWVNRTAKSVEDYDAPEFFNEEGSLWLRRQN